MGDAESPEYEAAEEPLPPKPSKPVYRRPPSTITLADGTKPVAPIEVESESEDELEEEDGPTVEDIEEMLEQMNPPSPTPQPTRAQINAEAAREIGREKAREAMKRSNVDVATQLKEQKKVEKSAQDIFEEENIEICRVMNGYRNEYKGKINYRFRPHYTPDIKRSILLAEKHEVETILNCQDAPTMLKDVLVKGSEFIEKFSLWLGWEEFNLNQFADDIAISAKSGYFKSELDQLSISWASWLAQPPEYRLAMKMGWIFLRRITDNSPTLNGSSRKMQAPVSISQEKLRTYSDL